MNFTTRQEQIVKTALRLIARHGIQYLTIKHIAAAIGFSEPAVYRHFDSKRDIMLAILDYFEEVSLEIKQQLQDDGMTGREKVDYFLQNRYELFTGNRDLAKVIFNEELFMNDAVLSRRILKIIQAHRRLLIRIIREGQREGSIRADIKPDALFYIIIGSMRLLVNRWCYSDFAFDLKSEGGVLWQAVENTIKPE